MIIAPRKDIEIVATNINMLEPGVDVYSPTDTYSNGALVQVNGDTHKIYKSTLEGNIGVNPTLDVNPTTGVGSAWVDYGATNYNRAFDNLSSNKCRNIELIYYKFKISDVDLLMINAIEADNVRIVVTNLDNSQELLNETIITKTRDVEDWFDWTYAVDEYKKSLFKLLPMVFNATLEIYINAPGGTAEVGHIVYGRSKNVGLTLADPAPITSRRGITSKVRDASGNLVTRKISRYKRITINCIIDTYAVDSVENRLDYFADTPCIIVGDERDGGFSSLSIYGEIKDHDMPIGISKSIYQLTVEGYL